MGRFSQRKPALPPENYFTCKVCQQMLLEYDRYQHMRTHTGEKTIQCDVCRETFTDRGNLSRHRRIHVEEKRFQCDV
ncbi:UNVERIFIED_CONTAM: zinc finger protein [Trichonephila clavipes]